MPRAPSLWLARLDTPPASLTDLAALRARTGLDPDEGRRPAIARRLERGELEVHKLA